MLLAFTRKTARAVPDPATGETAVQEVAGLDVGLTWLRDEMVRAFTDAYNEAQVGQRSRPDRLIRPDGILTPATPSKPTRIPR